MRGLAFSLLLVATSAGAAGPAPGRYQATLCVATAAAPASCGPARFELRRGGRAQLDIATMQGTMEIDEFSTIYEWQDGRLRFTARGEVASRAQGRF